MALEKTILIVDDEKNTRDGLRDALEDHYEVYVAADIAGAFAALETEPADVLITDLRLAGEDGMELLERVLKLPKPPICIMMTAYGSVDTAVEAMKRGAYDFVTKPLNIDRLELLIQRALRSRDPSENAELRQQVSRAHGLESMIGESPAMVEVFETIKQVAPSRATVLIQGESGTGKELVAHAIHALSTRPTRNSLPCIARRFRRNFLKASCLGMNGAPLRGRLSGGSAVSSRRTGGTLFLDEIGEIDETTQVKLLRVLGERTFERVGGNQTLEADVRLIAATNKDLASWWPKAGFATTSIFG